MGDGVDSYEIPALPSETRHCQQCCTVPGAPAGISCCGYVQGGLGEAGSCIYGFVFLPVIVTARPQLRQLCVSILVTGISCSIHLPLGEGILLSLQFSGLQVVFSVTQHSLVHLFLGPAASSGRMREYSQAPSSTALFFAWQWWLLDHSCHTSVFYLCPSHWVQLQYGLIT